MQQLSDNNDVLVFGYSESTSIATQEMVNLDALPADQQPNPADLHFVLVEDLNNPNGGFLERLPFLATESFPATPADTPYQTDIYYIEYSGSSDFPQYPANILADSMPSPAYRPAPLFASWLANDFLHLGTRWGGLRADLSWI